MEDYLGWVTGLVVLVVFAFIVRHERRQARRLTERSKELERLSAELLRVNRVKSEFLANVSHELRTPLNAIVGFVELLRDGVYGDLTSRQMKPVERIEVSATHLRHLVDQILDLAKLAAGRLEVHSEIVDMRAFVLDVTSEMEPLLSEKQLRLSLSLSTTLPTVQTDPVHIRQILVNLIGNAVKYTATGTINIRARQIPTTDRHVPPQLRLPSSPLPSSSSPSSSYPPSYVQHQQIQQQTRHPESWIVIEVIDSGMGIAPADHERIFEEFEQVNAGSRSDSIRRGTGLGLPISRKLARLLGGELTVESVLGEGAEFTLWIPVVSVVPVKVSSESVQPNVDYRNVDYRVERPSSRDDVQA